MCSHEGAFEAFVPSSAHGTRRARRGRERGVRVGGEWRYARRLGSGIVASVSCALSRRAPRRPLASARGSARSARLTFTDCSRERTGWFGFGLDRVAAFGRDRPSAGRGAMAPPRTARSGSRRDGASELGAKWEERRRTSPDACATLKRSLEPATERCMMSSSPRCDRPSRSPSRVTEPSRNLGTLSRGRECGSRALCLGVGGRRVVCAQEAF